VSITVDGKALPFYRCFFNPLSLRNRNLSPTNKRVRLNYTLHFSSTTKQIDVGFFNLGGFHLADGKMPDKADFPEVLCVLDVLLRRLPDCGRLPLALVKLVRQCVAGQGDAVFSPAKYADGAQQSAAEACAARFAEAAIAVQPAPRSSVRCCG